MVELGVVRGRFQVFHLKHLEYVLAAKMRCRKLLIGIEEPDRIFERIRTRLHILRGLR